MCSSDLAVSLQVNTSNVGISASNYSEIQLADAGTVRSYWRNLRDGSGATIFSGNDHIQYALLGSEKMRLTSTGLGIGTSSPGAKLHVQTSAGYNVYFQTSGSAVRLNYLNDAASANVAAAYRANTYTWQKSDGSESLTLDDSEIGRAHV